MIEVTNKIKIYERDGQTLPIDLDQFLTVHSHGSARGRVVLEIDGARVTVLGNDLIAAITNAMNTAKGW